MRVSLVKLFLFLCLFLLISCGGSDQQYQGYVEAENLYLSAEYGGDLQRLAVHRGETVKKGDLLFKLDPNPEWFLIQEAVANLKQSKEQLIDLKKPKRDPEIEALVAQQKQTEAELRLAELKVKRYSTLYKKKFVSKESLDEAVENFNRLQEKREEDRANVELANMGSRENTIDAQASEVLATFEKLKRYRWRLAQKTVYAPNDGVIFDTYYQEGEYVGKNKPVLTLLPTYKKRIEFYVPSTALPFIKLGQTITFIPLGSQHASKAIVTYISPEVEYAPPVLYTRENSAKLVFRIKARIEHPESFKPGQPVDVWVPRHA